MILYVSSGLGCLIGILIVLALGTYTIEKLTRPLTKNARYDL